MAISLQNSQKNTQTGRLERRTLLNKRYIIVRTIGQGGMGAVYQARDKRHQTICAIKEMSLSMVPAEERKQAIDNFKAEAKLLAGLSHPNLPVFWDFFTEGARHFLVMEYIDGFTLEEYLERNHAPFPERRVLGWARQLCDVLAYLHSQRTPIIFRDMKPGNIMLTRNGRVKLIDFGIARLFHHRGSHDTQLLGTPGFAPPEQYGKAQTDERSDIYSLAITLCQLMTNTLSEQGFGLTDVQALNPNISLPVARALEKAAALAPEDRFQTVDAFRRALLGEGTFLFENGDQATTAEELAELCARFPEEASDYLFAGEIESWLQEIGDIDLARTAKRLRAMDNDPEEAIERFLQAVMGANARIRSSSGKQPVLGSQSGKSVAVRADARPAPTAPSHNGRALSAGSAEVIVQPLTLDFGEVYPGLSAPLSLAINGYKGAFVQGTLTTKEAWILIDQTTFDGMSTRVNVQVNTARLRGSTHYSGSIIVIPDDDDEEQDIVVKVEVDVLGGVGTNPAVTGNGQSRPDLVWSRAGASSVSGGDAIPAPTDEEDEEEDQDLAITSAGGMLMAPPIAATAANSNTPPNSARYNEYKAKYGPPGGGSNAASGAWDPLQATYQQRLWLQRGVTVFAAFMLASLCYTFLAAASHAAPLPPNPEFIAVLLGSVPCATLGAVIVNWDRTCSHMETLNRLSTGASTVLLALGLSELAWQSLVHQAAQPLHLVVMLLVAALSATLGTHTRVSTLVIGRLSWAMTYIRWIVIGIAGVVGAMLGFALAIGFALSWPSFLAALLGCAITLALVFWVDHQLNQITP
ncbi:MAG: protein kinase domain-containing protein [Ktedonobacteraceae bacterium]